MTDGRVLLEGQAYDDNFNSTIVMFTLTPDINGSYQNGTLSSSYQDGNLINTIAQLPAGYTPLFFASAVLPDGRVIFEGGEYNDPNSFDPAFTGKGAIYDPVKDQWATVSPPPFFANLWPAVTPVLPGYFDIYPYPRYPQPFTSTVVNPISDSQSVVLPNGTFMIADKFSKQAALLDAKTLTWTETGTATKNDFNSEENWVLLPNGKVLTMDLYLDYWAGYILTDPLDENTELYDPKTGQWSSAGTINPPLTYFPIGEVGTSVLRPDGTVFAVGDGGEIGPTVAWVYNSYTNRWTPGPPLKTISGGFVNFDDQGGALLPNGNVLFAGYEVVFALGGANPFPTDFFEFDGNQYIAQPQSLQAAAGTSSLRNLFINLPTGEVLTFDFTTELELYTSANPGHNPAWEPVIKSVPAQVKPGKSYVIHGVLFNGMSQGSMEGDDFQMATNYPLVRITNLATGHVFYSRTHDHSYMGVAATKKRVHTHFDVPLTQEVGPSKIEVIANGIASQPICIYVKGKSEQDDPNSNVMSNSKKCSGLKGDGNHDGYNDGNYDD